MIGGIIGDIIGSVYEAHQWASKELPLIQTLPIDKNVVIPLLKDTKWVRADYGWTDDTLCTLALYKAYIENTDFAETLKEICNRNVNDSIGFGKAFKSWLSEEIPKPYNSFANGSIMRVGFIPFLNIPLSKKLRLGYEMTKISHNHLDSYQAVQDFIMIAHTLKEDVTNKDKSKDCLRVYLDNREFALTVEDMHKQNKFELNALSTLYQAVSIVYESNSFEETLRNTFYVGGDSDTLATVACNLASILYPIPQDLLHMIEATMSMNKELNDLVVHFVENYWNRY